MCCCNAGWFLNVRPQGVHVHACVFAVDFETLGLEMGGAGAGGGGVRAIRGFGQHEMEQPFAK